MQYYKDHDPEAKFLVVNDNSTDRTGEICDECNVRHIDTIEKKHAKEGVPMADVGFFLGMVS